MPKAFLVFAASLLCGLLAGCYQLQPAYPKDALTFDEGLVGVWKMTRTEKSGEATSFEVKVEKRLAEVTNGKLGSARTISVGPFAAPSGEKKEKVPAYRLTVTTPDDKDPAAAPVTHELEAVLLEVEGTKLLAMQLAGDDEYLSKNFGLVIPVHFAMRVARDGDAVRVETMSIPIIWMPLVRPIDPPKTTAMLPTELGLWLVSDDDRYLEVLRSAAKSPEFWDQTPTVGARVKAP